MSKPEFVYVIYIAATPEKVFEALTDAKMSERYWHGNHVESDWKVGSPFALRLRRRGRSISRIAPVSVVVPSITSAIGEPTFQSVLSSVSNQYCRVNSLFVSASHNFSGVVSIKVT